MYTARVSVGGTRKADRVAQDLLRRIVGGEVAVGELLPKEAELAERYEVNRSVVREAIKLLEVHRLVRPIRRRGTEVLDPVASMSPDVLRAMLQPGPGRIDRQVLGSLLEIRAHLDEQMTTLAAERRTEADLEELVAAVDALEADLSSARDYTLGVDRFSLAIARATHNRVYQMMVWWNRMVVADLVDVFATTRPNTPAHLSGLRLLVDLIGRQEVEPVRSLVRAYHEWATPRLLAAAALASGEPIERAAALTEEAR